MIAALAGWVRRTPFALAMLAGSILVLVASETAWRHQMAAEIAWTGYQAGDVWHGDWWTVATTAFLAVHPVALLLSAVILVGVLGLAEITLGTWRTVVIFWATQLAAVVLFTLVVEVGAALDLEWLADMRPATLLGPYAASVGALMAASRMISLLWRRRVRAVTLGAALMLLLYVGHAQNLFMLLGALVGLVIGMAVLPARHPMPVARSTSREVRTNLAIVVAVFALGPLFSALAHVPVGPLSKLQNIIVNPVPSALQLEGSCSSAIKACGDIMHSAGILGPGGHLLALVPMLLLLACAEGLRRGNRMALWVAVYLHLVIGVMSAIYLQLFAGFGMPLLRGRRVLSISSTLWEVLPVVLVPFLIAALLLIFRRHFHIDPSPVLRRRTFVVMPLLLGGFVVLYAAVWFVEGNASGPYGFVGLLAGLPRILLPYPFPFGYGASVYPHGLFSTLLFSMGGAVFWLVSVLSVFGLFLSRRARGAVSADRAAAAELVRRGGDSLSWMSQWRGNNYWFNARGTAAIAYQAHAGVAVTVGGPFGDPGEFDAAAVEFLDYCAAQSLVPCFYSVTDGQWDVLQARGFRRAQVASETLLDVDTMEFKGKEWQNVRTALNKAAKLGITTLWSRYSALTTGQRTQIHEISEEWVSEKPLPEMGFTLGGVEELKDDAVQLCLAVDGDGRIHGITSWLPVYEGGVEKGWTLDFMRRNTDAFNGVMEFLIAQAVLHFKGQVPTISLSGTPLSTEPAPEHAEVSEQVVQGGETGPAGSADSRHSPAAVAQHPLAALEGTSMARILALVGRTLEPVYGFASLANFKKRFQPRHRTLYMVYQDPLSLPSIGRAVGEAYMPNVSVRQLARLLRKA